MEEQKRFDQGQHDSDGTQIKVKVSTPELPQEVKKLESPKEELLITAEADSLHKIQKHKFHFSKKALVVSMAASTVVLLVLASVLALYVAGKNNKNTAQNPQQAKVALMGAELNMVDGLAQSSADNKLWQDVKVGDQVKEGTYIRTQQTGRVIIMLDDGSAIRINNNSVVKINSLNAKNIVITNESGTIYTRLVKSDRQFSVNVADESYAAMGTAYITVNTDETKGVEVYESKVKLTKNNIEVPEGKLFYNESKIAGQSKAISDISIDKIKQDAFLAWNYQQDKNSNDFKDKLGYLTKIDEPKPTVAATPTPTAQPTAASSIKLSGVKYDTGVKLSWSLTGLSSTKGFKVVRSLSANPTYGKDSYQYVSDPSVRSYAWTIKDGKAYHFRVCIYNGETCTNYSNDILVTAPKVEQTSESTPTGTLSLTHSGGKNFSWVLNGSAPYGYKLVWNTGGSPVYPGSDYSFYSSQSTLNGSMNSETAAGTYKVRVCMYNNGSCLNYSNELTVTIP